MRITYHGAVYEVTNEADLLILVGTLLTLDAMRIAA